VNYSFKWEQNIGNSYLPIYTNNEKPFQKNEFKMSKTKQSLHTRKHILVTHITNKTPYNRITNNTIIHGTIALLE